MEGLDDAERVPGRQSRGLLRQVHQALQFGDVGEAPCAYHRTVGKITCAACQIITPSQGIGPGEVTARGISSYSSHYLLMSIFEKSDGLDDDVIEMLSNTKIMPIGRAVIVC